MGLKEARAKSLTDLESSWFSKSKEWRSHPNTAVIFGNRREESVPSNVFPNNRVMHALQAYLILTHAFLGQVRQW